MTLLPTLRPPESTFVSVPGRPDWAAVRDLLGGLRQRRKAVPLDLLMVADPTGYGDQVEVTTHLRGPWREPGVAHVDLPGSSPDHVVCDVTEPFVQAPEELAETLRQCAPAAIYAQGRLRGSSGSPTETVWEHSRATIYCPREVAHRLGDVRWAGPFSRTVDALGADFVPAGQADLPTLVETMACHQDVLGPVGVDLDHPETAITSRYLRGDDMLIAGEADPVSLVQLTLMDGWATSGGPQVLISDRDDWPSEWPQLDLQAFLRDGALDPLNCENPGDGVEYATDLLAHLGAGVLKVGRSLISDALHFGVSTGHRGTLSALQAAADAGRLNKQTLTRIRERIARYPGMAAWCGTGQYPAAWEMPQAQGVIHLGSFLEQGGLVGDFTKAADATYLALVLALRQKMEKVRHAGLHLNEPRALAAITAKRAAWRPGLSTPVTFATEDVSPWLENRLPGSRVVAVGPTREPAKLRQLLVAAGADVNLDILSAPPKSTDSEDMVYHMAVYLNGHAVLMGVPGAG